MLRKGLTDDSREDILLLRFRAGLDKRVAAQADFTVMARVISGLSGYTG